MTDLDIWTATREEARAIVRARHQSGCEWQYSNSGKVHRCPFYERCEGIQHTDEPLMCELSDEEAHIKPGESTLGKHVGHTKSSARGRVSDPLLGTQIGEEPYMRYMAKQKAKKEGKVA